jgi:hypothetical protein
MQFVVLDWSKQVLQYYVVKYRGTGECKIKYKTGYGKAKS